VVLDDSCQPKVCHHHRAILAERQDIDTMTNKKLYYEPSSKLTILSISVPVLLRDFILPYQGAIIISFILESDNMGCAKPARVLTLA